MTATFHRVAEIEEVAIDRPPEKERFPTTVTLISYESPRMYENTPKPKSEAN